MSTLSSQASIAAILAAGRNTRRRTALAGITNLNNPELDPNPWRLPVADDAGWDTADTGAVDLNVAFHEDLRVRTVYLVVNELGLPLTGIYRLEIDSTTSTYDATAEAPTTGDQLMQEWADKINTDLSASVVATRVRYKNPSGNAEYDAIKIQAIPNTGTPGNGIPDGTDYETFSIGAATLAPVGASLHLCREVDYARVEVFSRSSAIESSAALDSYPTGLGTMANGWQLMEEEYLTEKGWDKRIRCEGRSALWLRLFEIETTDDAFTTTNSGDGINTVINLVGCFVAATDQP